MGLKNKISIFPTQPGCYLMKDESGNIIYVGKAKNIKSRVGSYFTGAHNEKTTKLVSEIKDIEFIITNTEQESLILEMNLIKKYLPKYNIRLVDDKTYPYIEITNERHPQIKIIRSKQRKRGRLFGPYPNAYSARQTVNLLNRLYPFRKCSGRVGKHCLYYHMGQCYACSLEHQEFDYSNIINEVSKFLKGDTKIIINKLESKMEEASSQLNFEQAGEYRDLITSIEETTEKQIMTVNDLKDRDFVGYSINDTDISINILMMRNGKIIDQNEIVLSYFIDPFDMLESYLQQFYEHSVIFEMCVDSKTNEVLKKHTNLPKRFVPQRGDKKQLLNLSMKNAEHNLLYYNELYRSKEEVLNQTLEQLNEALGFNVGKIEAFDNSQLFGVAPISAMISYENGKFNKKNYRKYHIKTAVQDDYQSLREAMYRRYQRLLVEDGAFPDLILVDGGIGHINTALEVLESLNLDIKVLGLKKDSRHQLESVIDKNQNVIDFNEYNLLERFFKMISEEVHRFAIGFFRQTKSRIDQSSVLDNIKGLGPKRKMLLLKNFNSLEKIKEASLEDLIEIGLPESVAKNIVEEFKDEENN